MMSRRLGLRPDLRLGGAGAFTGTTHYVDTVTGNDSDDGLTADTAFLSLANAITAWINAGRNGRIYISAPEATPVQAIHQLTTLTSGTLEIRGLNGANWYSINGFNRNSGWTDTGGGVYSRAGVSSTEAWVSIVDPIYGDYTQMGYGGATTTPAEGTVGLVAGVTYVHLPGGVNPNTVSRLQLQAFARTYQIPALSTAIVKFYDMIHHFSSAEGAIEALGGTIYVQDCEFHYANGVELRNDAIGLCNNVSSIYAYSDGFDARNTSQLTLINCEASYCRDEGVSPHDSSTLVLSGGRYHHNAHSGCAAINSSVVAFNGVTFDFNGIDAPGAGIEGGHGVALANTASGTIQNCDMANNVDSGIYNIGTGLLTLTNNTSGIANGNGDADVGV